MSEAFYDGFFRVQPHIPVAMLGLADEAVAVATKTNLDLYFTPEAYSVMGMHRKHMLRKPHADFQLGMLFVPEAYSPIPLDTHGPFTGPLLRHEGLKPADALVAYARERLQPKTPSAQWYDALREIPIIRAA